MGVAVYRVGFGNGSGDRRPDRGEKFPSFPGISMDVGAGYLVRFSQRWTRTNDGARCVAKKRLVTTERRSCGHSSEGRLAEGGEDNFLRVAFPELSALATPGSSS